MAKSLQGQTTRKAKYLRALRRLGFRARMATKDGRKVLARRRQKGRHALDKGAKIATGKAKSVRSPRRR